jgi:hypothetical protein
MITPEKTQAYQQAYAAAQAGGMNNTDSHELALDQATRSQPTKDLATLENEMHQANAALKKTARKNPLAAFSTPEYKAAKAAYRAFWTASDAARTAKI